MLLLQETPLHPYPTGRQPKAGSNLAVQRHKCKQAGVMYWEQVYLSLLHIGTMILVVLCETSNPAKHTKLLNAQTLSGSFAIPDLAVQRHKRN